MKTVITIMLIILGSYSFASDAGLNQLINSRESQLIEYRQLQDSLIANKVVKYTLLNEKLLLINSLDSNIISVANNEITALNDSIINLNKSIRILRTDTDRLQERTVNDLRMILILKVAAAVFIVTILIFIYLLINKKPKQVPVAGLTVDLNEVQKANDELLREIERLKSKEHYLIEENEEKLKLQKELYDDLLHKFHTLEVEFNQYKHQSSVTVSNNPIGADSTEMKEENQKLKDHVNSLKVQLDDSRAKNQAILRKIDKLISDLSGVNSVS